MTSDDVWICLLMLLVRLVSDQTSAAHIPIHTKNDSACYGTFNDYVNLACDQGEYIRVSRTVYGAKPSTMDCKPFATRTHPQPECCQPGPDDCIISLGAGSSKCPQGGVSCNLVADWVNTYTHCDQSVFPLTTNYMSVHYTCEKNEETSQELTTSTVTDEKPTTTEPQSSSDSQANLTSRDPDSQPETRRSDPVTEPVTEPAPGAHTDPTTERLTSRNVQEKENTTLSVVLTSGSHSSDVELSDTLVAVVVGGSIGMCLTLVLFLFYWGRKKRMRIVSNKQPTVWDYLLTNTFTVRGYNGYDHFSSTRSSASSDGETGSPVVRKNMWLPNIVQDSNEAQDDVISNYDNTKYKVPKVELHPTASPSPYAILNLEALHGSRHRDNHEA